MVVVSVMGSDRFAAGYNVAKLARERAALAGPITARIVWAAQFRGFVGQPRVGDSRRDRLRSRDAHAAPRRSDRPTDGLLPRPHATVAGPAFEEWLAKAA
jgi:hypothetical protein